MFLQIVILLLGLLMVIGGANYLVDGASSVARKTGISEFVIGLVIVGFGTSLPELVVSVTGAVAHNSDIAVGNVSTCRHYKAEPLQGYPADHSRYIHSGFDGQVRRP